MNIDNNFKFALIGGDTRQHYMARLFENKGYKCNIWGCGSFHTLTGGKTIECENPESAVKGVNAVILPLPVSRDNEHLSSKDAFGGDTNEYKLSEIFSIIPEGIPVLCGGANQFCRSLAEENGINLYDYYDNEGVMIKNAWVTAEGALEILIREMPVTIRNANFAVFGFGRVGSAIAHALKSLGANVYVFARSEKDLATASINGCIPVLLEKKYHGSVSFDAVINTVPIMLFDYEMLQSLSINNIFLDLASCDTYDKYAAKKLGIKAVKALSLPGKTSPETAAEILCDSIFDILSH